MFVHLTPMKWDSSRKRKRNLNISRWGWPRRMQQFNVGLEKEVGSDSESHSPASPWSTDIRMNQWKSSMLAKALGWSPTPWGFRVRFYSHRNISSVVLCFYLQSILSLLFWLHPESLLSPWTAPVLVPPSLMWIVVSCILSCPNLATDPAGLR